MALQPQFRRPRTEARLAGDRNRSLASQNGSLAPGEMGQGSYGPLGGAGGPPRRFARHLPVERDGVTHYVAVDSVVAVHANAHYTYIFDGTAKLFCPLPISDVEARLDTSRFLRVHRSHIVNIERVVGSSAPATAGWSNWPPRTPTRFRSAAAGSAG